MVEESIIKKRNIYKAEREPSTMEKMFGRGEQPQRGGISATTGEIIEGTPVKYPEARYVSREAQDIYRRPSKETGSMGTFHAKQLPFDIEREAKKRIGIAKYNIQKEISTYKEGQKQKELQKLMQERQQRQAQIEYRQQYESAKAKLQAELRLRQEMGLLPQRPPRRIPKMYQLTHARGFMEGDPFSSSSPFDEPNPFTGRGKKKNPFTGGNPFGL